MGIARAMGCVLFLLTVLLGRCAAGEMECYHLRSSSAVTISLPRHGESDTVVCKWPSGKCKKLKAKKTDKQLVIQVGVDDMEAGETFLILYAPEWLNLEDKTPPAALRFELDGKAIPEGDECRWLEKSPRTVLLEVEDKENPIKEESLSVVVNGKALPLSDPKVTYKAASKQRGVLTCDLSGLLGDGGTVSSVTVRADDCAVDDARLEKTVRFKVSPSRKMPDGTVITIDSLVDSDGWKKWWVVQDGKVMDTSFKTTAGNTWQSDKTTSPHWILFEFPKPRTVSKVQIYWSYWECYRTSVRYEIQTWDGQKWVTQVKVDGQKEQQCSTHTFFKPVTTSKLRILQPGNCGHEGRKELMWIAEVKIE